MSILIRTDRATSKQEASNEKIYPAVVRWSGFPLMLTIRRAVIYCLLYLLKLMVIIGLHENGQQSDMTTTWSVVKVVMWSRGGGLTWRSHVGANTIPIPHPTNLALFGHKITFYRLRGLILLQGAQIGAGGWDPMAPLTLTMDTIEQKILWVSRFLKVRFYHQRWNWDKRVGLLMVWRP